MQEERDSIQDIKSTENKATGRILKRNLLQISGISEKGQMQCSI